MDTWTANERSSDVALAGPSWLAGGSMGLEGSAVTLGLTCAALVAALALGRHAQ